MHIVKQYQMDQKFDEGYCCFTMRETTTCGCWKLEINTSKKDKPTIYTVADVASKILCDDYPELKKEGIDQLLVDIRVDTKTIRLELEKGYSRQRVLDEIAKNIRVS